MNSDNQNLSGWRYSSIPLERKEEKWNWNLIAYGYGVTIGEEWAIHTFATAFLQINSLKQHKGKVFLMEVKFHINLHLKFKMYI